MQLSFYFANHTPGRESELGAILSDFCNRQCLSEADLAVKKIYETERGEIFAVSLEWAPESADPEKNDCEEQIIRALMATALNHRFIPLDKSGNEIFLTPPYGFDIILYHPDGNMEENLQALVIQLANEMPGHEGKFHIQTHVPHDEQGEYYFLSLRFQDYWTKEARERLMLAFYFRLLLLARKQGYEAVITSQS